MTKLPGKFWVRLIGDSGECGGNLYIWPISEQAISATAISPSDREDSWPVLAEASVYGYELTLDDNATLLKSSLEPNELFEPDHPDGLRGRLKTGNRAGLLVVNITRLDGSFLSAPLEIASSKLNYEDEYQWMLRDITAELTEVALSRFGPTQSSYVPLDRGDPATLYQRFAFLQSILQSEEYQQALQLVLARPYTDWQRKRRNRDIAQGARASQATIRALSSGNPRRLLPEPLGVLQSVPTRVAEEGLEPTTDNVPNQFVKTLLKDWRGLAQAVSEALLAEEAAFKRPPAPVIRGLRESGRLLDYLDSILAMPLLRDTSKLHQSFGPNQVLLRRPGYRELARMQQQAQLAAQLSWDGGDLVFGAGQRDVATLYEYWVFLQVGRIVAEFCGKAFDYADLFQVSANGLQLSLRKRRAQVVTGRVTATGLELDLELWFNRPFRRDKGESWSRDMRPDLSLGIGSSRASQPLERTWLHFDAKYRVERLLDILGSAEMNDSAEETSEDEPSEQALREDLLKMHAYRDAIRRSTGAYVIYPGHGASIVDESFLEYHELLPGLGAFALCPSDQGPALGEPGLRSFLRDVLDHFGDALSRRRRADFWVSKAMAPLPLPPRTDPLASRSVEGLWFLNRPPEDEPLLIAGSDFAKWFPKQYRLIFRTDGPQDLPAGVFRSQWVAGLFLPGEVILLQVDDQASVGGASAGIQPLSGNWLSVEAVRSFPPPAWLTELLILKLLGDEEFLFVSWARIAEDGLQHSLKQLG